MNKRNKYFETESGSILCRKKERCMTFLPPISKPVSKTKNTLVSLIQELRREMSHISKCCGCRVTAGGTSLFPVVLANVTQNENGDLYWLLLRRSHGEKCHRHRGHASFVNLPVSVSINL